MSDNRFSNLMGGLKSSGEPAEKEQPATQSKPKKAKKKSADKAPTAKADADPKMKRGTSKSIAKYKNPDYEKGTYYLPKELTHQMRIYGATQRLEMSELVEYAVREYIENQPL